MKKTKLISICLSFLIAISTILALDIPAFAADANELACRQVFDANYYASTYTDVLIAVGGSEKALLKHYMENGIYEGRNASAVFNATSYKNRYSDLQAAYGNDMLAYVRHYVSCGVTEGRDATPSANKIYVNTNKNTYSQLGSYSTKYVQSSARATNIGLAAAHINGFVLAPGAEFSYSNTVGPRTPENGFVEAPVFINKEHAMGIGGGICQVSSTLYACMKTIGIPATERHPHSLPVTYVPEGWDATVSGTVLDLKFVNPYSKPLMISAQTGNGVLTVSLWLQN